ncbi:MAG: hypothetical protein LCH54_15740 [Bacteroidetes bacterium]|nr:hypothetical protein [Bacteroidota bacterium]
MGSHVRPDRLVKLGDILTIIDDQIQFQLDRLKELEQIDSKNQVKAVEIRKEELKKIKILIMMKV